MNIANQIHCKHQHKRCFVYTAMLIVIIIVLSSGCVESDSSSTASSNTSPTPSPAPVPIPTSSPIITPPLKPATSEVSSNLMVKNIEGIRAMSSSGDKSPTIDLLKIEVGLDVGSALVDINKFVISITDGTTANNLIYAANDKTYGSAMTGYSASNTPTQNQAAMFTQGDIQKFFTVEKIRDEDASFSQSNPVMNAGDVIKIYVATTSDHASSSGYQYIGGISTGGELKTSHLNLLSKTTVSIILTPETGAVTPVDFITPSSYDVKETVQLYP